MVLKIDPKRSERQIVKMYREATVNSGGGVDKMTFHMFQAMPQYPYLIK